MYKLLVYIQYMSRQSGLPLLSYATCVRVTPTLGYNALYYVI